MSTRKHGKRRGILAVSVGLTCVTAAGAALLATTGGAASAATVELNPEKEQDRIEQVLANCNNPESTKAVCTWSDVKIEEGAKKAEIVKDAQSNNRWINCGSTVSFQTVAWSYQTSFNFSVGLGGKFKLEKNILDRVFDGFKAEAEIIADFDFTKGKSYTSSTRIEVPSGQTGWIVHNGKRLKGTGTLTATNGGDTFVIKGIQIDTADGRDEGSIQGHTRKHTSADAAICSSAPAPITIEGEEGAGLVARPEDGDLPDANAG